MPRLNRHDRRRLAAEARAAGKSIKAAAKAATSAKAKPDKPRGFTAAGRPAVIAEVGDGQKLPTFSGTAYTGEPMTPEGWWNPVIIDLEGVKVPADQHRPALRQHDHEQIVGHTETVNVTTGAEGGIDVAGPFSGEQQHVDKVVVPARNGFKWQMSVGANPVRTEFLEAGEETEVNGRTVTGPMTISRETELGEVSFVPLGADGNTSATVSASKGGRPMLEKIRAALKEIAAGKYTASEIDDMDEAAAKAALKECMDASADDADDDEDDDAPPPKSARVPDLKAETAKAIKAAREEAAADLRRQTEIVARVKRHGVAEVEIDGKPVNLAAHAIEHGWTADQAELHALRAARPAGPVGVPGGLTYSPTAPAVSEAVLEAAVLQAHRHTFRLNDDSFYCDPTPDGKGVTRRVPQYVQAEAQRDLKARYTDQVEQAAHTLFKGRIGLKQLLALGMQAMGSTNRHDLSNEHGVTAMLREWKFREEQGIVAGGSSNLSISNVLANVMNKFALQGYLFTEQAWRDVAGVRAVNDFKPTKSINLLGDVMYKPFGSDGEIDNASVADQAFANQASPYGRMLTIPWPHIVNDDLGMLGTVPQKIGQGAGLKINDIFWSLWASLAAGSVKGSTPSGANLNGDDGTSFWRTGSDTTTPNKMYQKNKLSGGTSALSSSSLQTAKAVFDNQIDPNGNPLGFDGMTPVLLHGPSNWRTVTELLKAPALVYGGASAALQPNVNVWQGMFKPVMSRYVENAGYGNSTTAWWLLFNPLALPVIEIAFLNGVDTPAVLTAGPDFQFDRPGISIRGTLACGVSQQNFRGGVYSAGA